MFRYGVWCIKLLIQNLSFLFVEIHQSGHDIDSTSLSIIFCELILSCIFSSQIFKMVSLYMEKISAFLQQCPPWRSEPYSCLLSFIAMIMYGYMCIIDAVCLCAILRNLTLFYRE